MGSWSGSWWVWEDRVREGRREEPYLGKIAFTAHVERGKRRERVDERHHVGGHGGAMLALGVVGHHVGRRCGVVGVGSRGDGEVENGVELESGPESAPNRDPSAGREPGKGTLLVGL